MTQPAHAPALAGIRVVSLALNLPGPAALMRCRAMGADCVKIEPPAGDPMRHYNPGAYAHMHEGVDVLVADLKTPQGREVLHAHLASAQVLLTSFRPSALARLGLSWDALHSRHRALSQVAIVGATGAGADTPGHDLTYLAAHGLVPGLELPATLFADMAGSLAASEAILQSVLRARGGEGVFIEVGLADAASYVALPRAWGLTLPEGPVGGSHAGYRVYACSDGRVAVAALEPHFGRTLCEVAGVPFASNQTMFDATTHAGIASYIARRTRAELDRIAVEHDLPLHTLE